MERGIQLSNPEAFESITGKGVRGRIDGKEIALGNLRLLEDLGVSPPADTPMAGAQRAEDLRREGQTVMFVTIDGKLAGLIGVADPIKETTPDAIRQLHQEGLRIVMVTGDSRATAEAVARKLGIDDVMAEVLPDQKATMVKRLEAEGRVAFRYCGPDGTAFGGAANDDPNGSIRGIAGIYNETKTVLGMMPHPENATEAALGSIGGKPLFDGIAAALA